jgi:hypothetical protein
MSDVDAGIFPMDDTICKNCSHRLSRVIIPLDYEFFDIDVTMLDIEEGEDVLIEQHICTILQDDLNGVVKECNKFASVSEETFFIGNPYN